MDVLLANQDAVGYLRAQLGQQQACAAALGPSAGFHLGVILDEVVPSECDLHGVIAQVAIALLAPAELEQSVRERIEARTGLYSDVGLLGRLEYAQRIMRWLGDQLIEAWDPVTGTADVRSRGDSYAFRAVRVPTPTDGESPAAYRGRLRASIETGLLADPQPLR